MKDYGIVESTVKPDPIKIDEYSVWVSSEITPFERSEGEDQTFAGYTYHLIQYDKDEYIRMIQEENSQGLKQNRADIDYLALMTDVDLV